MAWLARPAPALWPRGLLGRAVRGRTTELSTVKPQQSCRRPHPLSQDSNRFATAEALWLTDFGKRALAARSRRRPCHDRHWPSTRNRTPHARLCGDARGRDGDRRPNTFGDARVTKVGLAELYSPKSHFEPHMCSTEGREVYETSDPVRFHC